MMYYVISFPLTLIFKYNFVKILLLMTFISVSISLKTSTILENKSQVFQRSDCTITVPNDLYQNELKIYIKLSTDTTENQKILSTKKNNCIDKSLQITL